MSTERDRLERLEAALATLTEAVHDAREALERAQLQESMKESD